MTKVRVNLYKQRMRNFYVFQNREPRKNIPNSHDPEYLQEYEKSHFIQGPRGTGRGTEVSALQKPLPILLSYVKASNMHSQQFQKQRIICIK